MVSKLGVHPKFTCTWMDCGVWWPLSRRNNKANPRGSVPQLGNLIVSTFITEHVIVN